MELGDTRTASRTASEAWLRYWVLPWQFVHLLGSAAWNVAGVMLVAQGRQPLGPTASAVVVMVLLLLGAGLWFGFRRSRALYVTMSILLGVGAFFAVRQAFVGEAAFWPSAFWRWSGAGLNLAGLAANIAGIAIALLRREALQAHSR